MSANSSKSSKGAQERVEELEAQVKYLQSQLAQLMEEKRRWTRTPIPFHVEESDEEANNYQVNSSDEEVPRRKRQGSNLEDFRVEIPEFEGKLDPDHFLDWLQTIERIFEYKEVPEENKVKLVALKLRKYASIWWANLTAKRARNGKGKIRTWAKMRDKLKAKFLPSHYVQDNYFKLHHLKQGTKSVEEYTREFEQLLLKCDLREDDAQTMVRYLSGLDESIAHVVELHPYSSLDDLSSLAYKVEQQKKSKGKGTLSRPPSRPYSTTKPPYYPPKPQNPPQTKNAPPTVPNPSTKAPPKPKDKIRCFRCQGLGHIASECPNKRIISLAEYQASFEEPHDHQEDEEGENYEEENVEEVEEGPDEGELLVIRRPLSGFATHDNME